VVDDDGVPVTVDVTTTTLFAGAKTLADIKVGDEVEVKGTRETSGNVSASVIIDFSAMPPGTEVKGNIDGITAPDFTVGGKTIGTDASTIISRAGTALKFADLAVGQSVDVLGTVQADGSVLASHVEVMP